MKRYITLITLLGLFGFLTYISGIYLVKAEYSFKQLARKTQELEEEVPVEEIESPQQVPKNAATMITPEEKKPVEEERTVEGSPPSPSEPPRISMDFENANLKDVLKIFCQQSGLNFIAGENVELKPVTLYLNNVSVEDALNSIIKANGLTYERAEGSNVFIVTKSPEPEVKLETRIFKLNYAFAEDKTIIGVDNKEQTIKGIKESVQKLLTPNGDLSVDSRTNSLIITDIPSRFSIIEDAIKNLDAVLPQILIEAKIVEISTSDLDQLGIKWSSLSGYTLGFYNPTRTYLSTRSGGQQRTDVYTAETKDSIKSELVYNPLEGAGSETITYTDTSSTGRSLTETFTKTLLKSDLRSAVLSADDFAVTISLLLTDKNADVIASPNIVTAHSKEAKITVGEQYPIPQFAYNDDTGTWEVQGFEYKDIGIILRVTPYADIQKGNITLELHPEVSNIVGSVNFHGAELPIIGTRDAITNVAIKDGDTLAIGGLLKDASSTTVTKVPLLGDIPVLGHFFRHKEELKTKTNTIIFITPHILKDYKPPVGASSEVSVPVPIVGTSQPINMPEIKEERTTYQFKHR